LHIREKSEPKLQDCIDQIGIRAPIENKLRGKRSLCCG